MTLPSLKVDGTQTKVERVTVTLSHSEQVNLCRQVLEKIFDIPERAYIKDGNWLMEVWEEHGGTHSWDNEKKYRKVEGIDAMVLEVFKRLR